MDVVDHALDLIKRLDPTQIEDHLKRISTLNPDIMEELSGAVDRPLHAKLCTTTDRHYLLCDYNREGDSYRYILEVSDKPRSPFTNEYEPACDGAKPSYKLRQIELLANDAFDTYRELLVFYGEIYFRYYAGGISSVYTWDLDTGFAMVVLIRNCEILCWWLIVACCDVEKNVGSWNSIHVFEVIESLRASAQYKLTSTVILGLASSSTSTSSLVLAGNLTRQHEQECKLAKYEDHIVNVGRMVEEMEIRMRHQLSIVYFDRTKDIATQMRSIEDLQTQAKLDGIKREMRREMFKE